MAPNDSGGPLSFIKSIYALDTIDTRFTTPSGVPYRRRQNETDANGKREDDDNNKSGLGLLERTATATSTTSGGVAESGIQAETLRTKWGTPEFYLYYLIVGIAVPYMFWVAYDVSRPSDPRYRRYEPWLSEGWIPGRKIDLSDFQYGHLRRNLPVMGLLLIFHPLGRQLWNFIFPIRQQQTRGNTPISGRSSPFQRSPTPTPEAADARLRQRTSYDFTFAIIFLIILHGFSAAKILFILALNYKIGTALPKKYVPATTWIFNLVVLFANELCDGYKFRSIAVVLTGGAPPPGEVPNSLVSFGTWLDSYRGLQPKWAVLFNITILRLISFNLDYYWSLDRRSGSPIEKQLDPANLSERDRVAISANRDDYTFTNYVAYAIYAPLYLTGPILTFNDYISQCRYKPATIETSRTIKYAIRFALVLLSMEIILHYDYVGAITKARPIWSSYTPAQISLLSFFNLHIIWLKLLVPWRLFRLWSLVDGIDPPENMIRCVSNNYSTLSFWRSWHRSYYRWLLRYIYIPLGGTSFRTWVGAARSIVTYLTVFTFVALWHDIKMRLLIWGWLIVFFFLPEIVAGYLFPRKKWESKPVQYRMLCAAGGVLNVLMMISANLVGFAVGLDGLETIIRGVLREWNGLIFILMASGILFVGIQVMFEIRSSELRKGINLKC